MAQTPSKHSRLAWLSFAAGVVGLVVALAAISSIYWYPWQDPQGWDKLGLLFVVFWESIITLLTSVIAGAAALYRIGRSEGRFAGRSLAMTGIGLAVLQVAVILWALYGPGR
jgi:hypothetical protein